MPPLLRSLYCFKGEANPILCLQPYVLMFLCFPPCFFVNACIFVITQPSLLLFLSFNP